MIPISARMGVKLEGFSSWRNRLSPSIPPRDRIQAVTVVPTLAPIMTLMACPRVIMPELTKPTTITVVAEEDWMTPVTARPVRKPSIRLEVSLPRMVRRLLPAARSRDSPMTFMPNRNRHRPPIIVRISNKSMVYYLSCVFMTVQFYQENIKSIIREM